MKLELMIHRVETHLFTLGKTLLQAGEKADLQEDLELVQGELARRKSDLIQAVARRDALRRSIQARKVEADELRVQVESSFRRGKSSQALRQALELESLRRSISADEAELPKLDQTIWSLSFNLRQMERRLAQIREQIAGR